MATPFDTAKSAILGVPADPNKKPSRTGIVQAFAEMQRNIEGVASGALVKSTLAALTAMTSAPSASCMAWVLNDSTVINNGVYENTGSASAPVWVRRSDVPQFFISGINVGSGTANAIQITTDLPVPITDGRCIVCIPIVATNTSATVTVSINGLTPLPIVTNSGNNVVIGGLIAGMLVIGTVSGGKFRLISDQATQAIQTEIENTVNLLTATTVLNLEKTTDITTISVPSIVKYIKTVNYTQTNDGGGATFNRLSSAPSPVKPWHKQSADGAWWFMLQNDVKIECFGAGRNFVTDDVAAIKAARDYVYAFSAVTEGARGKIYCDRNRILQINDTIAFPTPIAIDFRCLILELRGNGSNPITFDFGTVATSAGQNTQYEPKFGNLVAINQNTTVPTLIVSTGGIGYRFRNCQFSEFEFKSTRQFSYKAFDVDASGSSFPNPDRQHVQQNNFKLGQVGYSGYGLIVRSKDPEYAAAQVNVFEFQDFISNVINIDVGESSGGDLPADSSVNIFRGACEKQSTWPSGVGISIQGSYNKFELSFCECAIVLQAGAVQNTITAQNTPTTGIVFVDNSGSNTNVVRFGPPEAGQINKNISTATDNTNTPNNYGVPINVTVLTNITGSSGGATGVQFIITGPDNVEWIVDEFIETAVTTPVSRYITMRGRVPAYWNWKIKKSVIGTGSVNYSNTRVFAE